MLIDSWEKHNPCIFYHNKQYTSIVIPRYCQIMYTPYPIIVPCLTVILYMRFMVKLARYRRLGEHPLVSTGRVGPVQHHQHLHPHNADPPWKSGHCR